METLATVIGLGIFLALLLYVAVILDKEHVFFKIFLLLLVLFSLNLLAKASVDNYYVCDTYLLNSTGHQSGDVTYYYTEVCPLKDFSTGKSILRLSNLFTVVLTIYILLFTLWKATGGFLNMQKYVQDMFRRRP